MQTITIGAFEARRKFGKILDAVGFQGDTVVVEKNGDRLAAIVPIDMLEKWEERRAAFFEQIRAISERSNLSEEEAMRLADEALQAVRAERRKEQGNAFR
jgi:prevent-host-death family protein